LVRVSDLRGLGAYSGGGLAGGVVDWRWDQRRVWSADRRGGSAWGLLKCWGREAGGGLVGSWPGDGPGNGRWRLP